MKNLMTVYFYLSIPIIFLLVSNTMAAQDVKPDSANLKMFNNAISGSVGTLIGYYNNVNIYYERMLRRDSNKSKVATFVKAGCGGYSSPWGGTGSYLLGQFGILTGVEKHHFEASAGLIKYSSGSEKIETLLSGSLGYRTQKPDGQFLFRTGLSWPETLYLGFGVRF
ncbi:MAG: hypothetical protein IH591_05475 [Bacteroidales bacterium]|nr:hypothetical protein [Bacteroidales bacterium]